MKKEIPLITVGELRRQLEGVPDDWNISFSGLEFSRIKNRGPTLLQIEFSQSVYLNDEGEVVVQNHR